MVMKNVSFFFKVMSVCLLLTLSYSCFAGQGKYVGGDISLLLAYERHNSPYLDGEGKPIDDLVRWFIDECGWNTFRVRLFVSPDSLSDPSVCQDLKYVKQLGRRIKEAGAYFMLDYHYSDPWVDAGNIQAPRAWKNCTVAQKRDSLYHYTCRTLQALIDEGAAPDMVQVGNEIMYGFMGIRVSPYEDAGNHWDDYLQVLKAGCQAVREKLPEAQIIIHTDRLSNVDYNRFYYGRLIENEIDFDVIGLSYYPFWHGFIKDLKKGLDGINRDFPQKAVQIVEAGYPFQYWPTSGVNYNTSKTWAATPAGQYDCIHDIIAALSDYEQVEGLCYWCPEDAGNGDDTDWSTSNGTVASTWTNRGLWDPNTSHTGHKPVTCSKGMAHYLFRDFLKESAAGVKPILSEGLPSSEKFITADGRFLIRHPGGIYDVCGQSVR